MTFLPVTDDPEDEDLPHVEIIEPLITDHRGRWMRVTTCARSYGWLLRTWRDAARAAGEEAAFWSQNIEEVERFADTKDKFLLQAIAAGRAFMAEQKEPQ